MKNTGVAVMAAPVFILPHYLTNSDYFHTIIIPWKIKHIKIGKKKII